MQIRAARDDDFVAITTITNYYIATSTIHFAYEPIAPNDLYSAWLTQRDRFPWVVAEDRTDVIGYAKSGTWRDRAAYRWTTEIGLYVAHDARRRGVGRALYAALLDQVAAKGFRSAVAGITMPNDASVALHQAFGFESVGTVRDAGWKHGRWCDVAWFQKRFATDDRGPATPV